MRKTLLCFLVVVFLVSLSSKAVAYAADKSYTVNRGENLYRISMKTGLSVAAIMEANKMADTTVFPGQVLQIPGSRMETYVVQAGDNLFRIAIEHNTTVQNLKMANNLASDIINIGQKLYVPETQKNNQPMPLPVSMPTANQDAATVESTGRKSSDSREEDSDTGSSMVISGQVITENDKKLLARLIYAEARGESDEGKTAVGAVILNRLKSPQFPKTIRDIIYEKRGSVYQFTPVENGSINMEPDASAVSAAEKALKGVDPSKGALFFYNPEKTTDRWIRTLPEKLRIGNHVFAK